MRFAKWHTFWELGLDADHEFTDGLGSRLVVRACQPYLVVRPRDARRFGHSYTRLSQKREEVSEEVSG